LSVLCTPSFVECVGVGARVAQALYEFIASLRVEESASGQLQLIRPLVGIGAGTPDAGAIPAGNRTDVFVVLGAVTATGSSPAVELK
jgi:hypothetical protein